MILPIENLPSQKFYTVINDIDYTFEINYNALYDFWIMDIKTNDWEIRGIKLVAGINLVGQFYYVPFQLISNNISDPTRNDIDSFILEVILND